MNLAEAIQPVLPARIAIIGGGGKTTALFQLARQITGKTWVTTTTHLGTDQLGFADRHFIVDQISDEIEEQWLGQKVTLLTGEFTPDDRIKGPDNEKLSKIYLSADKRKVSLLVEADGSRSRPVKAPDSNEPATPRWAGLVITVVGLSALGQAFSEATVHRVDPFRQITGMRQGQLITVESLVQLLINPLGGLKNSPEQAIKVALLNQADTSQLCYQAAVAVPLLLAGGYDMVLAGSLKFAPDAILCWRR